MLTIVLAWFRLTRVASCCEPIGRSLQPFLRLLSGLGPVLFIAHLAFLAFTHAFFSLQGGPLTLSLYGSFVTLITAGMPGELSDDALEAVLLYLAVSVFTIIILNIFIGVIGEEYSRLQEESVLSFRQQRAKICLDYMLRKPFMGSDVCPRLLKRLVTLLVILSGMGLQMHSAMYGSCFHELEGLVYLLLLMFTHAMAFQAEHHLPMCRLFSHDENVEKFFWFCCKADGQTCDVDLEELHLGSDGVDLS